MFTGLAAFLGRIEGVSRCGIWTDEPTDHGFDASLLVDVDLSRTPSAAVEERIRWSEVEVDDCFSGPTGNVLGTTVGPQWPELQIAGMIWLEEKFLARLPDRLRPACPPAGAEGRAYEFQSVVYWTGTGDARAGTRYTGHHAMILEERGTLARVSIFPPGSSMRATAKPTSMWIDFASVEQCDAGADSLTKIGVGDRAKEGALFRALNSVEAAR